MSNCDEVKYPTSSSEFAKYVFVTRLMLQCQTHPLPCLAAAAYAVPVSVQGCWAAGCTRLLSCGAGDQLMVHWHEPFQRIHRHGCCSRLSWRLSLSLFSLAGWKFALLETVSSTLYFGEHATVWGHCSILSESISKAKPREKILAEDLLKSLIWYQESINILFWDHFVCNYWAPVCSSISNQASVGPRDPPTPLSKWCKPHSHRSALCASLSIQKIPPSLTFSLSASLSACFLIGWGNVGNFMWSLSQLPGRPDPPLAVQLPRSAGRQAVRPGGVQHWEGVPSQGTGGLGKLKALLTTGQQRDWKLGAVRHWMLPKRGRSAVWFAENFQGIPAKTTIKSDFFVRSSYECHEPHFDTDPNTTCRKWFGNMLCNWRYPRQED